MNFDERRAAAIANAQLVMWAALYPPIFETAATGRFIVTYFGYDAALGGHMQKTQRWMSCWHERVLEPPTFFSLS